MSFLTDDAKAALEQKFQAMQNEEEVQPAQQETKNEARAAENSFQSKQDAKNVEVSSTDDKDEPGHAVPYQRFKEVNESKKQLKAKTAELERQLAEARAQLDRKSESKSNESSYKSDLDDIIYSLENDSMSDEKYSSLEKRLQTFEVRAAQAELEAEISVINRKYPDVPETVLLQAVITNPETNLAEVAREYTQFIAEIEERALAKHGKRAPAAPPRPQSSGTPVVSTSGKPRTMADARTAALAFLKQNGL